MDKSPSELILAGSRSYSMYVCTQRAIPYVGDGLKSSQRIALWCIRNVSGKIKVAALSGKMIEANLYVHGSAEGAISMMAAPFLNNVPLLDGKGAFGTLSAPKSIGAGRYTYISLSDFSKKTVMADSELYEMVPSVDGDNEICKSFLPLVPTVLLNGISGMAVGFSTDILPHKLSDLKKNVVRVLEGKKPTKMKPFWENYDVDVVDLNTDDDGSESYQVSGKIIRHNTTTVEIVSIPPTLDIEKLQSNLDKLIDSGKIVSYENNTSNKISVMVKFTRASLSEYDDSDIIKLLKLSARMTERLVCVDFYDDNIRIFKDTSELIEEWVEWRLKFYTKRYELLKEQTSEKIQFLKNIIKCFEADLPSRLKLIKSRAELSDTIKNICGREEKRIVDFASYRWTIEYRQKVEETLKEEERNFTRYGKYLEDENKIKSIFVREING